MLHSGILPHHPRWAKLFENLRYIVVDELHAYRGVFGSHFCNVLRRLRRIAAHYGSAPQFICSSATIANPRELAERLTEAPFVHVSESGAPRVLVATLSGNRHMIGAALIGAAAAAEGWSVVYLGADVPATEIATAAVASGARAVAISVTYSADATRTLRELRALAGSLAPEVDFVVGGAALVPHARELSQSGIEFGEDLDAFRRMLRRASRV